MESDLRIDIREIFGAGIKAADPRGSILRLCAWDAAKDKLVIGESSYDLAGRRILVAGIGKAACSMAAALEEMLGSRIDSGFIITKDGYTRPLRHFEIREASHPIPDERGMIASRELLSYVRDTGGEDVIIFLVSGGGSSLMALPADGISLGDMQSMTNILLTSGASIREVNALRKHLSGIHGGQFAREVYPAKLIALVISDVIGDELDVIASGPTVPDESTYDDCRMILDKYHIADKIPTNIRHRLEEGAKGNIEETPKRGDPVFMNVTTHLAGSSYEALEAAREAARKRGYTTMILSSCIQGETREVATVLSAIMRDVRLKGIPVAPPACIIAGGETTVTVHGSGLGGRNMEFVLAAAMEIEGIERVAVLSGATDGTDGHTDAAGAIADGATIAYAREKGINAAEYLANNDSYRFFEKTGGLIVTGPTMTNVMDIMILLVGA